MELELYKKNLFWLVHYIQDEVSISSIWKHAHNLRDEGVFSSIILSQLLTTNWVKLFTSLLCYAYVWIHQVRRLWSLKITHSVHCLYWRHSNKTHIIHLMSMFTLQKTIPFQGVLVLDIRFIKTLLFFINLKNISRCLLRIILVHTGLGLVSSVVQPEDDWRV